MLGFHEAIPVGFSIVVTGLRIAQITGAGSNKSSANTQPVDCLLVKIAFQFMCKTVHHTVQITEKRLNRGRQPVDYIPQLCPVVNSRKVHPINDKSARRIAARMLQIGLYCLSLLHIRPGPDSQIVEENKATDPSLEHS